MLSGSCRNDRIRHQAAKVEHRNKCDNPFRDFHETHLFRRLEKDVPEAGTAYAGGSYERKCHPDYRPGCDFYTSDRVMTASLHSCQSSP